MILAVRYKNPGEKESILREYGIGYESYTDTPGDDFVFVSAVIETSMVIINSRHKGSSTLESVLSKLKDINTEDYYRKEFKELVKKLKK